MNKLAKVKPSYLQAWLERAFQGRPKYQLWNGRDRAQPSLALGFWVWAKHQRGTPGLLLCSLGILIHIFAPVFIRERLAALFGLPWKLSPMSPWNKWGKGRITLKETPVNQHWELQGTQADCLHQHYITTHIWKGTSHCSSNSASPFCKPKQPRISLLECICTALIPS